MIFVAVGTQFSFDRLIKAMDEWARDNNEEVIAQIAGGEYTPQYAKWERFLEGEQYNHYIKEASVFVSHAGMGNIISARNNNTPIIVMNRQYELGEHRNNHQADGIKWMAELSGVYAAPTQEILYSLLNDTQALQVANSIDTKKLDRLTQFLGDYIKTGKTA
ncbi:MAG: glycosyl transferase family 28 [Aquificaceae bacterium]|nr:MAG: glycosyl transferase family 28 [Aquificaceae bacterium]